MVFAKKCDGGGESGGNGVVFSPIVNLVQYDFLNYIHKFL